MCMRHGKRTRQSDKEKLSERKVLGKIYNFQLVANKNENQNRHPNKRNI